jgi:hypothetical protein
MARLRARFKVATEEEVEDILMEYGVLGVRVRYCRLTEATVDTVLEAFGSKRVAHSCAAPARSNVRSRCEMIRVFKKLVASLAPK